MQSCTRKACAMSYWLVTAMAVQWEPGWPTEQEIAYRD